MTDGNPCAFCAMLATRTDYTSPFAAQYVVGRGKTTRLGARGRRGLGVRPRGSRSLGEKYHDNCGCTVAEVFDDWEPSYAERQQKELYEEARKACAEKGLEPNLKNILAQMRELGDGTVHDAHVPEGEKKKPGRKPKTQTGGSGGGGKKPPRQLMGFGDREPSRRVRGMLGPDTPDEFPEFNGWRPDVRRSEIETFDEVDAEVLLDGDGSGHGHHRHGSGRGKTEFPEGWGEREVIDWVNAIIDSPADGQPEATGFSLKGSYRGVRGVVIVRHYGRWYIASGYPL
ncbi:MAG: EndoU domain-containing protein [Propionibacteriaceae bacterium]|nr:EndoU domain-containing protein [Propionibacteriaceae bacterium]